MSTAAQPILGAAAAAGTVLLVAPYLARLTRTVPDQQDTQWWRGERASSRRTALTAAIGLAVGGLAGAAAGWSALLPAFGWLALLVTPLIVIDFEHHRLPNRLVFALAGGEVALGALAPGVRDDWAPLLHGAEGAAAVLTVLFALAFVSPRSFGYGDVKLGGVLGGYLGWFGWRAVYWGIFAGFLIGAVVGLVLIASRRASLKTAMAFGPMLVLGALLVLALDADLAPYLT